MKKYNTLPIKVNKNGFLVCPICGGDNIHPTAIDCRSPGRANGHVSINGKGIAINPEEPPTGRGVHIWLTFQCENGDTFEYSFRFHKGTTHVGGIGESLNDEEVEYFSPETIWRD